MQDSHLKLYLLFIGKRKEHTHTHTQRIGAQGKCECDHPPPHFRFNSHRTRLEDPISGDIEPGTQWNGTPGRPNHPHCSALQWGANQIPSRRSRWSISSSPFSRWDYLLSFGPHGWMFTATVAIQPSGCGMLMLSFSWCRANSDPKCTGVGGGPQRPWCGAFKTTWMEDMDYFSF